MKLLAFVTILLIQSSALANECGDPDMSHWETSLPFKTAQITLHWTGVYEGSDSVCSLTYTSDSGKLISLDVYGQPIIYESQNLIAFISCADDGCENTLTVADISRGVVLKTQLPIDEKSQFYLQALWQGSSREIAIRVVPPIQKSIICSVTDTIRCISNEI